MHYVTSPAQAGRKNEFMVTKVSAAAIVAPIPVPPSPVPDSSAAPVVENLPDQIPQGRTGFAILELVPGLLRSLWEYACAVDHVFREFSEQ